MTRSPRAAGFTLLEVMIGLALLGFGLVVLIKSTTGNIVNAKQSQMIGVVTDLSRGKMYDIEEKLLKEGFTETDQSEDDRTFEEEGWPDIQYSYKVEQVELPSFDQLQAMSTGSGSGSAARGSASGSDDAPTGSFQDSALGGIISMVGGGFAGGSEDIDSKAGASFIQGFYSIIQETLKAAIRKVTLTVKFKVVGEERELVTVAFFTDPTALDRSLPFGGGADTSGTGSAGTGTGTDTGSGSRPGRTPPIRTPGGTPGGKGPGG